MVDIKKSHIAMIVSRYPPYKGGTETQCALLSKELTHRNYRVTVLTERLETMLPQEEFIGNLKIVRFLTCRWRIGAACLFSVKALFYLLTHFDIDFLHAHMLATPALVAMTAGACLRKPSLAKVAGARSTGDVATSNASFPGRCKLWLLKQSRIHWVCPSETTLREIQVLKISSSRIHFIPNGVDTKNFNVASELEKRTLRNVYGLPVNKPLAIYAGRAAAGKGVDILLNTWERSSKNIEWHWGLILVIAGDVTPALSEKIRLLAGKVWLYQNVNELFPFYQLSDLAILVSQGEGVSNFLLEAMACGLPCLTSDEAAVASDASAEEWRISAGPAPSAEWLQDLLIRHQDQSSKLRSMGKSARAAVEAQFSSSKVVDAYEALYQQLLTPI